MTHMRVYPDLDIRVPTGKEHLLVQGMRSCCRPPWHWQDKDTHGHAVSEDRCYFHRDATPGFVPCTVCIHRHNDNLWVVVNIVPDHAGNRIDHETYVELLAEFDTQIAGPAAEQVGGMTAIGADTETLADHFSPEALQLLTLFCTSSNASDLGTHPSDQQKWMAFLIHVARCDTPVHCDTFGACLQAGGLWPQHGIDKLVREYDFAMRLLRQARQTKAL